MRILIMRRLPIIINLLLHREARLIRHLLIQPIKLLLLIQCTFVRVLLVGVLLAGYGLGVGSGVGLDIDELAHQA